LRIYFSVPDSLTPWDTMQLICFVGQCIFKEALPSRFNAPLLVLQTDVAQLGRIVFELVVGKSPNKTICKGF
jgi:hypothetical protein